MNSKIVNVIKKGELIFLMEKETKKSLLLITFGVVLFALLMHFSEVIKILQRGVSLTLPIMVGLILAFVLNVPMKMFERLFAKLKKKYPQLKKMPVTSLSLFATLACIVLLIGIVYTMFVPGLVASVRSIYNVFMENMPKWLSWLRSNGMDTAWISREVTSWDFNKLLTQITGNVGNVGNALGKVVNATTSAFGVAMNVMMGFIIAIYVLLSKVSLTRQCKKMIYAHLSKNHADKICYISSLVNETYSKFFSGQCIEAVILGLLIFIAFTVFRLPYANLIAVLTAILSFIPYIGAFASCFIGALLIVMVDPWKGLLSIVVYQVVQFIENQFIYPRVVGGSVGLAPLWTLSAALIGGNLFGAIGMIFAIPVTAVLYVLLKDDANRRLQRKKLDI